MPHRDRKFDVSLILFKFTFVVGVFFGGGFLALEGIHPFNWLKQGWMDTATLLDEQTRSCPPLLQPVVRPGDGVTLFDRDRAYSGWTVMQGWFSDGLQLQLVDMNGDVIHQWIIDFHDIWPDPKHISPEINIPQTPYNYHSQGLHVYPDGSIVANIGNQGAFKMNRCGDILWTVDRMTHHSVTRFSDGSFWMPANSDYVEMPEELLFGDVTKKQLAEQLGRYENLVLHVDATGQVIKEFSVLKALVDAGMERELHDILLIDPFDLTHVNDIEEITPALAAKIDGVVPGDLLISIRQLHMLAILDVDSGEIKWHQTGPWIRQHDPDITPDGNITLFNNRSSSVAVRSAPGSNIIEFDPQTGESIVLYPPPDASNPDMRFYTDIMGSHQVLPNGNLLITESRAGRVFEVTDSGEIVWEYVKAYDRVHAALIEESERFPKDYFKVEEWDCGCNTE